MNKPKVLLYVGIALVAALIGGFGLLADEVVEGDTLDFDRSVLVALREPGDLSNPLGPVWLEEAVRDVTGLGSFTVLGILVLIVVGHLFLSDKPRSAWFVGFSVIGGTIMSTVLKSLFDRERPDLTGVARVFTASFPSGHAAVSAVVFLTLGVLLAEITAERRLKVFYMSVAVALTIVVGLSRIYLGVHYPTDVVAGWSLGTAWALACFVAADVLGLRRKASVGHETIASDHPRL